MTVFVVNSSHDLNLTSAERFGAIRYVNHKYIYGDEIGDDGSLPAAFVDNMRRCADEFDADSDYLLIAGDHLQLVAFTAELSIIFPWFRVLRWDRIEQAYFGVKIKTGSDLTG